MRSSHRRVTIQDVARACEVAPSTVSNALSGKAHVSEETRSRIAEVAQQMGYRPSAVARSLRLQRSWSIGLLIGDITNPFFPELVRGVEDVAAAEQCDLILCNTDYSPEKEASYIQLLLDKQVDGLILASQQSDSEAVVQLQQQGVPFVLVNRRHHLVQANYVGLDNRGGIASTINHLVGLGHRRIALLRGPADSKSTAAEERYHGYLAALKAHGLALDPDIVIESDYTMAAGYQAAQRLVALPDPPTSAICTSDVMALGAIDGFLERGWRVPEDVSVIGWDDIFVSSLRFIGLTSVRQDKREMGSTAARLLLKQVRAKRQRRAQEVILVPELMVRRTTAPARQSGPRPSKSEELTGTTVPLPSPQL